MVSSAPSNVPRAELNSCTLLTRRIAAGENDHFQVTRRGSQVRWTLRYPPSGEAVNHPFFDRLRQVDISSVVHFVHERCRFLDAFEHILGRYVKRDAETGQFIDQKADKKPFKGVRK